VKKKPEKNEQIRSQGGIKSTRGGVRGYSSCSANDFRGVVEGEAGEGWGNGTGPTAWEVGPQRGGKLTNQTSLQDQAETRQIRQS